VKTSTSQERSVASDASLVRHSAAPIHAFGRLIRSAIPCCVAASFALLGQAKGQVWTGPSVWQFTGVNQATTSDIWWAETASFNRHDISWSSLEPSRGTWNLTSLTSAGTEVQAMEAQGGAMLLPVLDYGTNWAADLSTRSWSLGNLTWQIAPGSGGTMVCNKYTSGTLTGTTTYEIGHTGDNPPIPDFGHFPPANSSDWTAYVSQVVNYLHASPYNVQYFQVWNEAQEQSGFWVGSMGDYFNKIHLPAATTIHNAGAKVVYGGWPESGAISEYLSLLDTYNAWGSIDVLDTHYFGTPDGYDSVRTAANSRGYPNLGIWQTEYGFTADPAYIPSALTHRLYWALLNNWTQDKYKGFYFANWAPNDPKAYGYLCCLYSGSALSSHGQCLQNLTNLLGGRDLIATYPAVTSSPSYGYSQTAASTMENFAVPANNTIVTAVNLGTSDYNSVPSISFTFPVPIASIYKAQRVDIIGTTTDLTSTLVNNGTATTLPNVAVKDPVGSSARTWNDGTTSQRVFYVVITLNQPYEAENLAIAAQTSGITVTNSADPSFSNGEANFFNATAANQSITYDVPSVSAGTYDVRVGVKNYNNKGQWQLAISRMDQQGSAVNQGSVIDEYNAGTTYGEVDLGTWIPGTTSDKAFKFTVVGKNSASSGYGIAVDYIKLIPTFEAENLSIAAQTTGTTYTVSSDPNFSNGEALFFNAAASGQYITLDVPNVQAGSYDVHVGIKSYNNKGQWQLATSRIDQQSSAVNLGSPCDSYTAGTYYSDIDVGTWTAGSTSDKAFKFTVIGKNNSSAGYGIAIDYIRLYPQ
jgi:hypothetical protein